MGDPISQAAVKALIETGVLGVVILVLLGLLVWLINKLLGALGENTAAFRKLVDMLDDRPCLRGDRDLK